MTGDTGLKAVEPTVVLENSEIVIAEIRDMALGNLANLIPLIIRRETETCIDARLGGVVASSSRKDEIDGRKHRSLRQQFYDLDPSWRCETPTRPTATT
jgi:hypothetical protein